MQGPGEHAYICTSERKRDKGTNTKKSARFPRKARFEFDVTVLRPSLEAYSIIELFLKRGELGRIWGRMRPGRKLK